MEFKIVFLLALTAGLVGMLLGYLLRVLIGLSQKGSIEINLKEKILKADEEAKRVTLEAEEKAAEILKTTREDIREKEEKTKKTEERLIKKEELLDKRQGDIDKEVEEI